MLSITTITTSELSRLPGAPAIIDVCTDDDQGSDSRFLPGAARRDHPIVEQWAPEYGAKVAAVVCQRGQELSERAAGWLRHAGIDARALEVGPGRRRAVQRHALRYRECVLELPRRALHLRHDDPGVRAQIGAPDPSADTARLDLAPEAAGLLTASLGYSRMYSNDIEQLEVAMGFYDAFYPCCREATGETPQLTDRKEGMT